MVGRAWILTTAIALGFSMLALAVPAPHLAAAFGLLVLTGIARLALGPIVFEYVRKRRPDLIRQFQSLLPPPWAAGGLEFPVDSIVEAWRLGGRYLFEWSAEYEGLIPPWVADLNFDARAAAIGGALVLIIATLQTLR